MKKIAGNVGAVVFAAFVLGAQAAEVTADSAAIAARCWLQDDASLGCALGSGIDSVRTCSPQGDATFHVVKLDGGGFVVMSSDTTREPVVAFSSGGDLVESDDNPLWVLLKNDLALRTGGDSASGGAKRLRVLASEDDSGNEAKWRRLLGGGSRFAVKSGDGRSSISDVRVAPLVQSKWNQGNVGDDYCYNYYTPNHYVCGCVATAGAQIMRYFQWPLSSVSVAPFTNPYCAVAGALRTLTSQGGYCDWSQMPLVPDGSIADAERQAIGRLTSDIGIGVGMDYDSAGNGGSSSSGYMLAEVFTNRYGYANALAAQWGRDVSDSDGMKNALLSNFDAGLPVAISLRDNTGGHEIVGDGYGYSDGTLYLHFNMGWSGTDDAWYAPPQMAGSQCNFNVLNGFVCNVFTNRSDAGGVICSGRVLDATGSPIANAVVSAKKRGAVVKSATTDAKGIYAFVLPAGSYVLSASSGGASATKNVSLSANVGIRIITSGDSFGSYYTSPTPSVGNRCGQDITISGVAGVSEPQFDPPSCLFYPSTNVTISCATPGATIRYTRDGTDPTESSPVYSGPVFIDDDVEIRARAWKDGMNPSAVVSETYAYDAAQGAPKGDYFDNPIVISGESGSRVIADNAAYTVEDGEPKHTLENGSYYFQYHTVWYKWTAPGSGTMTFATKMTRYAGGTYVAVYTGDSLTALDRIGYRDEWDSDHWTRVSVEVTQGVSYRIVGMSCGEQYTDEFTLAWSGNLTVAQTATSTTEVPVEYDWLGRYFPGRAVADYETIAHADADGDGLDTWAEYLLGTDPTNALSRFEATIRMEGATPFVGCNIDTNRLAGFGYKCTTKGTSALNGDPQWSAENLESCYFFRLFVEKLFGAD